MCVFILKEMIRFYRKHSTPVYVCFLDASKAFDCVNHWKLFNVMIERKCPAFIIRLLMFWYRNQKLCVKWDNVLSEKFSVTNGRWYFISQTVQYLCQYFKCEFEWEIYRVLFKWKGCESSYADDLVLVSPTASGMNEFECVNSFLKTLD